MAALASLPRTSCPDPQGILAPRVLSSTPSTPCRCTPWRGPPAFVLPLQAAAEALDSGDEEEADAFLDGIEAGDQKDFTVRDRVGWTWKSRGQSCQGWGFRVAIRPLGSAQEQYLAVLFVHR